MKYETYIHPNTLNPPLFLHRPEEATRRRVSSREKVEQNTNNTMRKIVYLILFLLFIQFDSFAESTDISLLKRNWLTSVNDPFHITKIDSTAAPHSILLETLLDKKGVGFYSMLFPANDTLSQVEIKINYKTKNCSELYLRLINVGEGENVNSIDTLQLPLNEEWTTVHQMVEMKGALFLGISLEAKGNQQDNGQIWIDDLDLFVEGRNILEQEHEIGVSLTQADIIPLDDEKLVDFPLWNKRILAIGESVHGTETMSNLGIDLIKGRVTNNNSKLILMEIPLEYSLYINRYIDGDQSFKLDSISSYFENIFLPQSFISLFEWIREYNLNTQEKVYFLGFDQNSNQLTSKLDLFDFFYTLNDNAKNEDVRKLCELLLESKSSLHEVISFFDANQGFEDVLNKNEVDLIRYCLTMINDKRSTYYNYINRDSIMFKNTEFLMSKLLNENETVTLFCHLGHADYQGSSDRVVFKEIFSFGSYMRSKYGEAYSCVGLVAESGDFLTSNSNFNFKIAQLILSPAGSLEDLINKQNVERCYLSMEKFTSSDVLQSRNIGSSQRKEEFYFCIPKVRMDGVIFMSKVSAIQKDKDTLEKNLNVHVMTMQSYIRALEKTRPNYKYNK